MAPPNGPQRTGGQPTGGQPTGGQPTGGRATEHRSTPTGGRATEHRSTGRGSAWAKAILLGEHAVVAGAPALVAGLEAGMTAEAEAHPGPLHVEVRPWGLAATAGDGTVPGHALTALGGALTEAGLPVEALSARVRMQAEVPPSTGLGSSAAFAVSLVRALADLGGHPELAEPERAAELADAGEAVFHANPSGVDAAVAAHGGVGLYDRAGGFRPLALGAPATVVIANSGPRPPTREMVLQVQSRVEEDPAAREDLDRLGELALQGGDALTRGDLDALGRAMDEAQHHLVSLDLSTPDLDWLCAAARRAGALGAKLTGAGGGGCMVALCRPEDADVVLGTLTPRARWAGAFPLRAPKQP